MIEICGSQNLQPHTRRRTALDDCLNTINKTFPMTGIELNLIGNAIVLFEISKVFLVVEVNFNSHCDRYSGDR